MKNLALLLFAATAFASPKGTLCVAKECRTVDATTIAVEPADVARSFVWTAEDAMTIVIGTVAARETAIDLADKSLRVAKLGLRASRNWPLDTTFTITTKTQEWKTPIPAKLVPKFVELRMPPGAYTVAISAPHHRTATQKLQITTYDLPLSAVQLEPLPVVLGHVIAYEGKGDVPAAGAMIMRPDGKIVATTNGEGSFRAELEAPVPNHLRVLYGGFGSKVVAFDHALIGTTDVGTIRFAVGHTMTLHVRRPDGLAKETLHLAVVDTNRHRMPAIELRDLKRSADDEVVIRDVSPGTYAATVSGSDPLQRLSVNIEMKDADVERTLTITPYRLDGTARIGSDPIDAATIDFTDRSGWRARVPIAQGHFGGTLWQPGVLHGWLEVNDMPIPVESPELGASPSTWDISLPDRRITGRITDAESRQPIDRATLEVQFSAADGAHGSFPGRVGADGTYSVLTIALGTYELHVSAPEHIDGVAKFEVGDSATTERHDFPLARGVETIVNVVTPGGEAVSGAMVFDGGVVRKTDDDGRLSLRGNPGDARTLYILPLQGSFAIAHVTTSDDARVVPAVVPPAVGALQILAKAPPQRAAMVTVVRFNGELLPVAVSQRLNWGYLPAGVYEVWRVILPPGGTEARVADWVPSTPPARAGVSGGKTVLEVVPVPLP